MVMPCARFFLFVFACLASGHATAASEWFWQADGQALLKDYQDAPRLDNLFGVGALLAGDYLERGGFRLGYNFRHKNFIAVAEGDPQDLNENILHLGGFGNFYPDHLGGRLTLRMDSYVGRGEYRHLISASGPGALGQTSTDNFLVLNPIIALLDYAQTTYFDLGYAYSRYRAAGGAIGNLYVHQWAPTLGLGFNHGLDWLQLRAFFVRPSSGNRVSEADSTKALEVKWSHRLAVDAALGARDFTLSLLAGERRYAVDSDARVLNNVPDLQKGTLSLTVRWKFDDQSHLSLQGSYERYEDTAFGDDYGSMALLATLAQRW
jgi:hypothetical protein